LPEGAGELKLKDCRRASKRLVEEAMIKKVKGGYEVVSKTTGRNLGGPYKTRKEALKRLRQVEFFKHQKG